MPKMLSLNEGKEKYGKNFIGQVIRILDPFTIIISHDQIPLLKEGRMVQVFDIGEEVMNLDGVSLGQYVYLKDTLEIVQVEAGYAVCKKNIIDEKATSLFDISASPFTVKHKSKIELNIDSDQLEPVPEKTLKVKLGDAVRLVTF